MKQVLQNIFLVKTDSQTLLFKWLHLTERELLQIQSKVLCQHTKFKDMFIIELYHVAPWKWRPLVPSTIFYRRWTGTISLRNNSGNICGYYLTVAIFFEQINNYVQSFKILLDSMMTDNFRLLTEAEKHKRRFNTPIINVIAVVISGNEFNLRDKDLQKKRQSPSTSIWITEHMMLFYIHLRFGREKMDINLMSCKLIQQHEYIN